MKPLCFTEVQKNNRCTSSVLVFENSHGQDFIHLVIDCKAVLRNIETAVLGMDQTKLRPYEKLIKALIFLSIVRANWFVTAFLYDRESHKNFSLMFLSEGRCFFALSFTPL